MASLAKNRPSFGCSPTLCSHLHSAAYNCSDWLAIVKGRMGLPKTANWKRWNEIPFNRCTRLLLSVFWNSNCERTTDAHFQNHSDRMKRPSTVTLFSVYLYYYQMNHSVFWTITSTWPDLSIRGKKCPIGDDQLSQLSALSISIVWNVSTMEYATVVLLVRKEPPI